ncbi:hypothetical protein ElyMa_004496600 [Elysia marginata]|uniref:Endonuclease/exonuclease/phosphatase domain-containing protein n=1 Tax=Elysia marginata TaxID=1093978 RepID=A0AAV4HND8_9GAST|nr:hypothetical protein ElyMa_004496600 [Elysia marginata]
MVLNRLLTIWYYISKWRTLGKLRRFRDNKKRHPIVWCSLWRKFSEISTHDVIILMRDLNAQVDDSNSGDERTMGQHDCGSINNNGERVVKFCAANALQTSSHT